MSITLACKNLNCKARAILTIDDNVRIVNSDRLTERDVRFLCGLQWTSTRQRTNASRLNL